MNSEAFIQAELIKNKLNQLELQTQALKEQKYNELLRKNKNLQQKIDKANKISFQLRTHLSNWLFKEGYMGGERTKKFLDELDEILKGGSNE